MGLQKNTATDVERTDFAGTYRKERSAAFAGSNALSPANHGQSLRAFIVISSPDGDRLVPFHQLETNRRTA